MSVDALEENYGANTERPTTAFSVQVFVSPLGRAHAPRSSHSKQPLQYCPVRSEACAFNILKGRIHQGIVGMFLPVAFFL